MDVALWQRGLFLLLTHAFGIFQSDILSQCHLRPEQYTWKFFQRSNCVYVRVFTSPFLKRHTYVGSTTGTLGARERTRLGKYRQLARSQHVVGELALWWYLKTDTYHLAVPIVFMHCPLKRCLHAVEQFWIQFWRPTLNAPFINQILRGKHSLRTAAVRVTATRRHLFSFRLHRRYRQMAKKGYAVQPGPFRDASIVKAAMFSLQVLFDLAAEGLQSFLAAKLLRSGHVDDLLIYQLYRLGCSLGDPHIETTVRKRLRKIMAFRNMTVPSEPSSLCIRGLGHASFAADTRALMRTLLKDSHATVLPFHVPKLLITFKAHPKVKDVLFNFKELVEGWEPHGADSLPCDCQNLREQFPYLDLSDGHIASPASKLGIPGLLGDIASSSANNQVFASVSSLFGGFRASLHRWCKKHHVRFPAEEVLKIWWANQVQHHADFVCSARKWTVVDVLHLQSLFPTLVWHIRDHQAGHIHVFCRKKYAMMLDSTFQNEEVFRAVDLTAGQAFSMLESCVPRMLRKPLHGGFNSKRRMCPYLGHTSFQSTKRSGKEVAPSFHSAAIPPACSLWDCPRSSISWFWKLVHIAKRTMMRCPFGRMCTVISTRCPIRRLRAKSSVSSIKTLLVSSSASRKKDLGSPFGLCSADFTTWPSFLIFLLCWWISELQFALTKMKRYGRFSKASFAELVAKMFAFLWRCFSQLWIALSSSTCFVWGDMFLSKGWARQWGAQFLLRYATLL